MNLLATSTEPSLGVYYRYEDSRVSTPHYDGNGDVSYFASSQVRLRSLPVLKRTPCGVWVETVSGNRRFVRLQGRKRYACPTEQEAQQAFIARKKAQLRLLLTQVEHVEFALRTVGEEKAENASWQQNTMRKNSR